MKQLKEIRIYNHLTQQQAADLVGISLRSYKTYENDEGKFATFKYKYIYEKLQNAFPLDENHGILTIKDIKTTCKKVFQEYPVNYCVLFGSYAKGLATQKSDVDLLVVSDIKGLAFYGMIEALRENLCKRVDVLNIEQLKNNLELTNEILKDGIRIYEQCEK